MKVCVYQRCSTDEQSVDSQRTEIEAYLATRKPTRVRWYEDIGYSGARAERPAFQRMLADIRRNRYTHLVCFKLDRLSRSLVHAVQVLDELRRHGVTLISLRDGISFEGVYGQLMYALVAGLAEIEREGIRERVRAGLRAAKARGVKLGRSPAEIDLADARRRRKQGQTMNEIADRFGVSVRTLQRRLNGGDNKPPPKVR